MESRSQLEIAYLERLPVAKLANMPSAIRLTNIYKTFGDVKAVDGVDLDISHGEFFAMLGPSGSGKTTVLRMIAGFEMPDSGAIEIDGEEVSQTPPFNRNVNTVFQDYALFPHMTVLENIEYGLKVKKIEKNQRIVSSLKALERVKLSGYENRKPSQLSGGQRQRVALARALVNEPKVLLLDEPLGALDLKLRHEMQLELKEIQRSVGITFIFVTHDQEEALTMADRIAVFKDGKIVQVGTAKEIYESPDNTFVASFVGISNLVHKNGNTFSIRPEKIKFGNQFDIKSNGTVKAVTFLGALTRFDIKLDNGDEVTVLSENDGLTVHPQQGSNVQISWDSKYETQVS
jgi:putative spermidine/putrescine transport system ATP-binding protein